MNKRLLQFIACLFLVIGGPLFALGISRDAVKGPGVAAIMLGAWIVLLGILILIWASKKKVM